MFIATGRYLKFGILMALAAAGYADGVPEDCTQLIVGIAPSWNSMRGHLQLFERTSSRNWSPVAPAVPVLFGKSGVAWGSGLAGQGESGLRKTERDGRAPAGVFRIGVI